MLSVAMVGNWQNTGCCAMEGFGGIAEKNLKVRGGALLSWCSSFFPGLSQGSTFLLKHRRGPYLLLMLLLVPPWLWHCKSRSIWEGERKTADEGRKRFTHHVRLCLAMVLSGELITIAQAGRLALLQMRGQRTLQRGCHGACVCVFRSLEFGGGGRCGRKGR